jgi:hypothetical protein
VYTFVAEIFLPFLFYSPFREHRFLASLGNIFLMVTIALTGNYNFFNLLGVILMLVVLDDRFMFKYLHVKILQVMDISMPLECIVGELKRENIKYRHWAYRGLQQLRTLTAYTSMVSRPGFKFLVGTLSALPLDICFPASFSSTRETALHL